jgi:hypothetical protein
MKRAAVPSIFVVVVLLAVAVIAEAQQPKNVPRIGYQGAGSPDENEEAFRQGRHASTTPEWRHDAGTRETRWRMDDRCRAEHQCSLNTSPRIQ